MNGIFISLADWLERHSLPCFYKQYFHIDCPGCGMQRAFIELLRGNVLQSIILYPALLPILAMMVYMLLHILFKFKQGARNLKIMFIVCAVILVFNYIYKLL